MPHLDADTFVLQLHPGGWEKAKEDPSVTDKEFYEKYMTKLEQWESDTKTRGRKPDPRKRAIAADGSTSQAAVASTIDESETTANTYWDTCGVRASSTQPSQVNSHPARCWQTGK